MKCVGRKGNTTELGERSPNDVKYGIISVKLYYNIIIGMFRVNNSGPNADTWGTPSTMINKTRKGKEKRRTEVKINQWK